ncbi:hypothetical protein N865_08500 [Intrasporangium oryzae NRRL B-24470]|uniref:Immediate-early protein 2 n=1 Tax=Intrasporangium oryzae NRRL B-24470 TaxID=1386089 RepID=W9G7V1_9MICO|nr:SRPBCC family protein [Intrasporangium oryzae]EWT01352.1 hypothetical protein N865_08500 [Intrasporangium oryzae NRRL B-24470]
MAHFAVRILSPLPADQAWARILDLRAHSAVIPLTTLTGDILYAAGLVPGSRFVARTALGPIGFDDSMVVDEVTQPTAGHGAWARIRKEGKAIRGLIELTITPQGTGSRVEWSQDISVRGIPRVFDPVVARVARAAYGTTLRKLLARTPA